MKNRTLKSHSSFWFLTGQYGKTSPVYGCEMTEIAKYCSNCDTLSSSQEANFCSDCGNQLEQSNTSPQPLSSPQTNFVGLTPIQVKVLKAYESKLADFIKEYEISPSVIDDPDELDVKPEYLFSRVECFGSDAIEIDGETLEFTTDEELIAGEQSGAICYYLGGKPYKSEVPSRNFPYTTIIFYCDDCDGDGCENCDEEGRLLYSADFDQNGVRFTRFEP